MASKQSLRVGDRLNFVADQLPMSSFTVDALPQSPGCEDLLVVFGAHMGEIWEKMGGFCEVEQVVSEKRCVKRIKKNKL